MPAEYIKSLTGVRFFAAFWVVLFHFQGDLYRLIPPLETLRPVFEKGHYSVPLFFILSGFILSHTYFDKYALSSHAKFVWLRFARIWPTHLAVVLCFLGYYFLVYLLKIRIGGAPPSYGVLLQELVMTRAWTTRELAWNYPAWSIQAEWFAYLFLFPVCFLWFKAIHGKVTIFALSVILLCIHGVQPFADTPTRITDIALLFMAGSALYRLRSLVNLSRFASIGVLTGIATAGTAMAISLPVSKALIYLSFGLLVLSLSYDKGLVARALRSDLVVYGGTISYSLYMTHALVQLVYWTIGGKLPHSGTVAGPVVGVCLLASTLACASLFYHWVEAPGNLKLRRIYETKSSKPR